jgi:hypothetical protein
MVVPQEIKNITPYDPATTPAYIQKNMSIYNRNSCTSMFNYSSTIYNSQDMGSV